MRTECRFDDAHVSNIERELPWATRALINVNSRTFFASYSILLMTSSSSEEVLSSESDQSSASLERAERSDSATAREAELVQTLKDLQIVYNQLESQYLQSIFELECQMHETYIPLLERRAQVIDGSHEPSEAECRLKTDFLEPVEQQSSSDHTRGIPSFWLQTLKQVRRSTRERVGAPVCWHRRR